MRCYNCTETVTDEINPLMQLEEQEYEDTVDWFSLTHCSGPTDQFDDAGNVVMCWDCIDLAVDGRSGRL